VFEFELLAADALALSAGVILLNLMTFLLSIDLDVGSILAAVREVPVSRV
jgi:hypothetical protein